MLKHKKLLLVTAVLALGLLLPLAPHQVFAASEVPVCSSASGACTTFIDHFITPFIKLFTVLIGVFAVISIIVAGIQYASSADDPGKVTKAKDRIFQTVLGLLAYIFLFALLNYLIPGGLL